MTRLRLAGWTIRRDALVFVVAVVLWPLFVGLLAEIGQIGYIDGEDVEPADATVEMVLLLGLWGAGIAVAYAVFSWRRSRSN